MNSSRQHCLRTTRLARAGGLAGVLLAATLLAACGGGGSNSSTPTPILFVVPGPWSGTYNLNGGSNVNVTGAVSPGGFGYFADNQGNVFMLQAVPNTSPFISTLIGTPGPGTSFPVVSGVVSFTVNGTFSSTASSTSMQGALTSFDIAGNPPTITSTGLNGNFTLNTSTPYSGSITLAGLEGQWDGYYLAKTPAAVTLGFQGNGIFSGSDANGCTVSGSLVQQAPQFNLFYVNYTATGRGCPGVMNGLAYLGSSDTSGNFSGASGTYLYMGLFGLNVAYSAELKLQ
ncbi:MAG: hypothetical protein ACRETQ_12835 [Gammaproteobacteria bacterium]